MATIGSLAALVYALVSGDARMERAARGRGAALEARFLPLYRIEFQIV